MTTITPDTISPRENTWEGKKWISYDVRVKEYERGILWSTKSKELANLLEAKLNQECEVEFTDKISGDRTYRTIVKVDGKEAPKKQWGGGFSDARIVSELQAISTMLGDVRRLLEQLVGAGIPVGPAQSGWREAPAPAQSPTGTPRADVRLARPGTEPASGSSPPFDRVSVGASVGVGSPAASVAARQGEGAPDTRTEIAMGSAGTAPSPTLTIPTEIQKCLAVTMPNVPADKRVTWLRLWLKGHGLTDVPDKDSVEYAQLLDALTDMAGRK